MPEPNPRRPRRGRPRIRLSLRALMVVVLILGGWLGWVVHRAKVQHDLVSAIRQAGGRVQYDDEWRYKRATRAIWATRWLVDSLGIDYFSSVSGVNISNKGADEIAARVARFGTLDGVVFNGSDLSDAGLAQLKGMDIRMLYLEGTKVTDAGLESTRGMTNLEALDLFNTPVGDVGIAHVATLPRLRWLSLAQTKVGDPGVEHLERLHELRTLHLFGTKVGDLGAARLKSLANLKVLSLDRTKVTLTMFEDLRSALPGATVTPAPIATPVPGVAGPM